jgi:hypothetical protein
VRGRNHDRTLSAFSRVGPMHHGTQLHQ